MKKNNLKKMLLFLSIFLFFVISGGVYKIHDNFSDFFLGRYIYRDFFKEKINVLDFGAVGDGLHDDTTSIQSAINKASLLAGSGRNVIVYFPEGKYYISSTIKSEIKSKIDTNFGIEGANGLVEILPSGGFTVFELIYPEYGGHFLLSGLKIYKRKSEESGGDAIFVHALALLPANYSYADAQGLIENISCDGSSNKLDNRDIRILPFQSCIHLQNVMRTGINHIRYGNAGFYKNGFPNGKWKDGIGIWLDGVSGKYTTDNHISDLVQLGGFAAVALTGHIEGTHITSVTDINSSYGVYAPGRSWNLYHNHNIDIYPDNTSSLLSVSNSFFGTVFRGIYVVSGSYIFVNNNLFFNAFNGTEKNLSIDIDENSIIPISSKKISGFPRAYTYSSVDIDNCSWCVVSGNGSSGGLALNSVGYNQFHIMYDSENDEDRTPSKGGIISGNSSVNTNKFSIWVDGVYGGKIINNRVDTPQSTSEDMNPDTFMFDNDGSNDILGLLKHNIMVGSGFNIKINGGYIQYSSPKNIPICNSQLVGSVMLMGSSVTNWGEIVNTSGVTSPVLAFCNGSHWTVMGK